MADTSSSGEKTEEPTAKRLRDARRKGQVWRSKDLTSVGVFLAGAAAVDLTARRGWVELRAMIEGAVQELGRSPGPTTDRLDLALLSALRTLAFLSLPVVLAAAVAGGLIDFLQVRGVFSVAPLTPRLDKLNPITGLKNLLGARAWVELGKSLLKVSAATAVAWAVLRQSMGDVSLLAREGPVQTLTVLESVVSRVVLWVALVFLAAAGFDLWFQRRTFRKQLRMTKDEVRREHKETEGDGHVKARRRQLRMEMVFQAQVRAVRKADVLVTNPTHVAVALGYDAEHDTAPRVLAKGTDSVALRLRQEARDAGVPEVREVALARALLLLEVDEEIPERLYDAVAEILKLVYRARARLAAEEETGEARP